MQRALMVTAFTAVTAISAVVYAQAKRSPAPRTAELYFIAPQDGEVVTSPVNVKFGLKGMGIAPAGVAFEGAGHHHLLIDTELKNVDGPIPADANHLHFGKGQTEATLDLAPGEHRLQLVLGDHLHVPHEPPVMSAPITITVK